MSKIDEYRQQKKEHAGMMEEFAKNTKPESERIYAMNVDPVLVTVRRIDGGDWRHSEQRIRRFLKAAINENLEELLNKAIELSEENVSYLMAAAQDEAVNFIKSVGATESSQGENHATEKSENS